MINTQAPKQTFADNTLESNTVPTRLASVAQWASGPTHPFLGQAYVQRWTVGVIQKLGPTLELNPRPQA